MPSIGSGPSVPVGGQAEPDRAREVFDRMRTHPEQKRKGMVWDVDLANAALAKCMAQARKGWDGHVDPRGYGPNWWVRRHTLYKLPDYPHDDAANTVESLAHSGDGTLDGIKAPEYGVWNSWMGSPHHADHILGRNSTFVAQTQVGVAYHYLEGSVHGHYWCILTVAPEHS